MGFADQDLEVFYHSVLQRISRGLRSRGGEAEKRKRRPITRDILLKLLKECDQSTSDGANIHAALCVAFAGFLRMGEFTYDAADRLTDDFDEWHITRDSIVLSNDHMTLTLPASKTDCFRKEVSIPISATGDEACPVKSLRHLLTTFPGRTRDPLFKGSNGFSKKQIIS